ncbi:hypothetical protein BS50DRAFT_618639 [Corynespora cassiicola Philippines]|uniref:Uncharacterized protein n=1 Tax=Corynespora cassiicola Philippines TaxID=1448308 RepID=A0A2T2NW60_CORCC|nr:hypothetical protein BS50DRAFT_618639 [Corynespora cassiicola Philippines]
MKLSWGFILSSIYCSASAAKVGHVYTHDAHRKASPQSPPALTPETARLILAQRLGVSQFHSVDYADEDIIAKLNAFGGQRQRLFGGEAKGSQAHVLVWIDDVEDTSAIISDSSAWTGEFTIDNPPPASDNDRLIQDIIVQAESIPKLADPDSRIYLDSIDAEVTLKEVKKTGVYNDYLNVLRADKSDRLDASKLSKSISDLLKKDIGVTVVLMPPLASSAKRSAHAYGFYDMPSVEARREKTEAPLTLESTNSKPSNTPQSPNPNISDLEDFPVITAADDEGPVLGILPRCFSSEAACIKRTHNCTGHGACKVLQAGNKDLGTSDCYGCMCVDTITKVGEDHGMEGAKRQVTHWGGPACQKRDVSVPFFLFAGAGILLAFLISSSIGLLYSMGSEELPSVIGAGVSGPVRK